MTPPEHELTPEEKLLRLIKQGKQPKAPAEPTPTPPPAPAESPRIEEPAAIVQMPEPKQRPRRGHAITRWTGGIRSAGTRFAAFFEDLEPAPRLLVFACAAVLAWTLFHAVYDRVEAAAKIKRLWAMGAKAGAQDIASPAASLPADLAAGLPAKDIFKGLDGGAAPGTAPARVADLNQILSSYTLGGILGGDQPQAIIEDKRQNKTFFLNVGDTLGEIRIVAITDGKVTIAVGDEQADLNL